jgi:hypothetical protein
MNTQATSKPSLTVELKVEAVKEVKIVELFLVPK